MGYEQLLIQLAIGAGMGFLISAIAVLSDAQNKWNNRQFAYTAIISAFSALAIVQSYIVTNGALSAENLIPLLLMIAGASFLVNKGIKIAARSGIKK